MHILFLALGLGVLGLAGVIPPGDPVDDPELLDSYPKPDTAYYRYLKERRSKCVGDGAKLAEPVSMKMQKRAYSFTGPTLSLQGKDPDGVVSLGVLGAVKDFGDESRQALTLFLDRFEQEKVDAVLLLGDIATSEFELTKILLFCARRGWPVLAVIGNSESRAGFNRAVLAALRATPNIINMDIVRRVDLGGAVLVSLPGYLDRRFVHQRSGCTYKARDVRHLDKWTEGAGGPVVLVSHGPPLGQGPLALDYAAEGGNVGDPDLAEFIREHKIPFGLFSHILEAGGRSVDGAGQPVAPGKWSPRLDLNVGSANPLLWQLNGGKVSCGMAAVFRVKDQQASFAPLAFPCP